MNAIEKDNLSLKGVLPKEYAQPALEKYTTSGEAGHGKKNTVRNK